MFDILGCLCQYHPGIKHIITVTRNCYRHTPRYVRWVGCFKIYYHHHHHLLSQGIYTCIPETNYAHREYSVAAILLLLFMVLISLVSLLNLL